MRVMEVFKPGSEAKRREAVTEILIRYEEARSNI